MKTLGGLLLTFIALASLSAAGASSHNEVVEDLPVLLTGFAQDDEGRGRARRVPSGTGVPAVARNLVVSTDPIKVCADTAYYDAAEDAIEVWNDGLNLGRDVFVMADSCGTNSLTKTLTSINITSDSKDDTIGSVKGKCQGRGLACTHPSHISGGSTNGYRGQTHIGVVDQNYNAKRITDTERVAILAHELGHALGLAHPWELGTKDKNKVPIEVGRPFCAGNLLDDATREMLTPADRARYEAADNNAAVLAGALMNPAPSCWGDQPVSPGTPGTGYEYSTDTVVLRDYDKDLYKAGYTPQGVAEPKAGFNTNLSGQVTVSWDAKDVRVEKDFEVQVLVRNRATGDKEWKTVRGGTAPANQESVTFDRPKDTVEYTIVTKSATTAVKGSYATYRVISTTDAFGSVAPGEESISATVDHESPLKRVTYVCTEWGWYLTYRSTISNKVSSFRVPGYSTAAAARSVMESSAALIGSGGGVAPPFPILSKGVFCSKFVAMPVGSSRATEGDVGAVADPDAPAGETSNASRANSVPTHAQQAQLEAALAALTTCLRDIKSPTDKEVCVSTYADALDAIVARDASGD